MSSLLDALDAAQRRLLDAWLPGLEVIADHGWGLVDSHVLEVVHGGRRLVVKAAGPDHHHVRRDIRAHREWTGPWVATGHVGRMLHHDDDARLLVLEHLPGSLVLGSPEQGLPDTFRQAGVLAARFHAQLTVLDEDWHDRFRARVLAFLDRPHRIEAGHERLIRAEVEGWEGGAATVVPTHGDWHPRNWLVDEGTVRVIDLGRADLRPREEDFVRLARQDFARDPSLEAAYLEGYGGDPRDPELWRRTLVGEAVGTAVWAYSVGDEEFEAFGHGLVAQLV